MKWYKVLCHKQLYCWYEIRNIRAVEAVLMEFETYFSFEPCPASTSDPTYVIYVFKCSIEFDIFHLKSQFSY